jgi:hypothetical protein
MTNQLTVRFDAENGTAAVSRSASARNLALAAATAAASQAFAFTAAAQSELQPCEGGEDKNPIVYPEGVVIVAALAGFAGAVLGGYVGNRLGKK